MKKTFMLIIINFMVFSSLIGGLEILCQLGYLIKNRVLLLTTSRVQNDVFEIHPFLARRLRSNVKVTKNSKTITTTENHTRWTGAEPNDDNLIRIAVIGGSTTFGTGVTDEDSWPALLQAKLGKQYAVINYGVPGYSTAENIIQMALIVPEKRPQMVIFYEGWNDIRNYHENDLGPDYYGHGMRQLGVRNNFATFWLINAIASKLPKQHYKIFDKPDHYVDEIYVRNLNTLNLLSESIDAFAIFVPQVLNYAEYDGKEGSYPWTRHIKKSAMSNLMGHFNSRMEGVCSHGTRRCVVLSEVLEEKWNPDNFIDDGHFSRSGGLRFAEIIAHYIRSEFGFGGGKEAPKKGAALYGVPLHSILARSHSINSFGVREINGGTR